MCCFSQPVDYVRATQIFARPAKDAGQYVVYSMNLKAGSELAMILPIPTPKSPQGGRGQLHQPGEVPRLLRRHAQRVPGAPRRRPGQG